MPHCVHHTCLVWLCSPPPHREHRFWLSQYCWQDPWQVLAVAWLWIFASSSLGQAESCPFFKASPWLVEIRMLTWIQREFPSLCQGRVSVPETWFQWKDFMFSSACWCLFSSRRAWWCWLAEQCVQSERNRFQVFRPLVFAGGNCYLMFNPRERDSAVTEW